MAYKWRSDQTGRVLRFEAKKTTGVTIGLAILGLVFVVAGCLTIKGNPFQIMGLTIDQSEVRGLVLLGLVAIIVGFAVPRAFNEYMPDSISFDNGLGLVEVRKRKGCFLMPYQDLEKVDVRTIARTSAKGGTSYEFMLYFSKKDGSVWDLVPSGDRKRMAAMLVELGGRLELGVPCLSRAGPELPRGLVEADGQLLWSRRLGGKDFASCLVFLLAGGIFLLFWSAVLSNWEPGFLVLCVVVGFFSLAYAYLFAMFLRKAVGKVSFRHVLAFSSEGIEYVVTSRAGKPRSSMKIPSQDLKAVGFHHKDVRLKFDVAILSEKDSALFEEQQMDDPILLDFSFRKSPYKNSIVLDLDMLDAVEKLQFEDYIQRKAKAVCGADMK